MAAADTCAQGRAGAAAGPPCDGKRRAESEEFEREPVPEGGYKGLFSFLAIFVGRHTAGTEFTIGPMYIVHGASAFDVIVGLLVGNVLATLSWRFWCAPVAVKKRLTTYYQLELIVGPQVMVLYNILVSVLLAMVAGAMFAVSGTAFGVLFDVPMPGLHDWLPTSWAWCVVVCTVGAVTAVIAAFGFSRISLFSKFIVPYMFAVIVYMAIESLRELGIRSPSGFWEVANQKIWTNQAEEGFAKYTFFHVMCSAWFCDLMVHIGMNDLTILRYGKTASVGWSSAAGMIAGHYFTWIVAGFLYAAQLQHDPTQTSVAPGPMAKAIGGVNGLICVVLAGWSTANPIIYEAGLALQALLGPQWPTWRVTLGVGLLATVAGLFPALVMRILDLLAFGGLVLAPMGVVLLLDCWALPALGLVDEYWSRAGSLGRPSATNWPAVVAWALPNALMLPLVLSGCLSTFFAPLAGVPFAAALYLCGSWLRDRRGAGTATSGSDGGQMQATDPPRLTLPAEGGLPCSAIV